jgi:hypothetical protein
LRMAAVESEEPNREAGDGEANRVEKLISRRTGVSNNDGSGRGDSAKEKCERKRKE